MADSEPEAALRATADLSPISPSPVHSAAHLVVSSLQQTADTIDAMVAAAASAAATTNGNVNGAGGVQHPEAAHTTLLSTGGVDDIVDDESFSDAYGEDPAVEATAEEQQQHQQQQHQQQQQQDPVDNSDDYAKTFDSPIGPDEGEGFDSQIISSDPQESNRVSSSDNLPSLSSGVSHVAPQTSATSQAYANLSAAQSQADSKVALPASSQPSIPALATTVSSKAPLLPPGIDSREKETQSSIDIQKLMADLTAQPAEAKSGSSDRPTAASFANEASAASNPITPTVLPSSSSLPPRPPMPQDALHSYASQHHPPGTNSHNPASVAMPPMSGQHPPFAAAGAPGTSTEALGRLPHPPPTGLHAPGPVASLNPVYASNPHGFSNDRPQAADYQRQWDQFMSDERQYMSEAKWDRFPEGSRIFIGNLSSDKVSKRDVFEIFYRFGRLAQISLKSAYGFVQYHTVDEGRRALENLQGIEVRGRRIHLEISRAQDKPKKERKPSPDRRARDNTRDNGHGNNDGRRGDKHSRDENRSGRNYSPRRGDHQGRSNNQSHGRDRGHHENARRGRSRSPGYGRDKDYRRRSPSPYNGRSRHENDLDLPRRYGSDVPDVQIIMQPDVNRDFATWVEGAFKAKGLKTEVMFLHPRIPKEQVIQRQAAEGVHGVVDLDLRAQTLGRIPVHSFDRSGGMQSVRFEQYIDLEPGTAAEVIVRAKASAAANFAQPYGGSTVGGYVPPQYGAQPPQTQTSIFSGISQQNAYQPQTQNVATDIASLMGQVDAATLQRLLSTIQGNPQGMLQAGQGLHPNIPHVVHNQVSPSPHVDIQAILGSLTGSSTSQHHPAHAPGPYGSPYGGQPAAGAGQPQSGGGDAAAQVQNIMAQLARFRQ